MRKKITKRILALVLALALCTALMLPGFAASVSLPEIATPSAAQSNDDHPHHWLDWKINRLGYDYVNPSYHNTSMEITQLCTFYGCGATQTVFATRYESHDNGTYCNLCQHRIA